MSKTDRIRLILDNLHDQATLTATSASPGTPIDATQRNERNRVWRSTDTSDQVIEGALSAGAFVDGLALLNHNLSSAATLRLELLSGSTVKWDSGAAPTAEIIPAGVWRAGIDPWGATYNGRIDRPATTLTTPVTAITGYRLTLSDPANADGVIQVGRIVLGLAFTPKFNMSYGVEMASPDRATHEYSAGKTLRTIGGGSPRRRAQFQLEWLTEADRSRLVQELAQRGMIADVFVDLYPQSTGIERLYSAFLARMSSGYADTHDFFKNRKTQITFIEV